MAFNPFDVFRRNQRILFAILTVFIMFMFTLSFGAGDFFTRFPQWLSSRRGYGSVMAEVNGSKIHASELNQIGARRQMANQYMAEAGVRASGRLFKSVQDGTPRVSLEHQAVIRQALQLHQLLMSPRLTPDLLGFIQQGIGSLNQQLNQIAAAKDVKADDVTMAVSTRALLNLDLHLLTSGRLYFTNQPNATWTDRLEFLLWLEKADQLGITFTTKDVDTLTRDEFYDKATDEDWKAALDGVRGARAFTTEALTQALADEFRVRAAQAAVMGSTYVRGPLAEGYDAPYDYYEFYKDQTSPTRYGVVAVPAANFLDKVTAAPGESDLRALFTKAQGVVPNPELPAIGLRKPREIKVQYLEAKGDEPFYQKAAADALPKLEANAYLVVALAPAAAPNPLAGAIAAAGMQTVRDPLLQAQYQREKEREKFNIEEFWYNRLFGLYSNVSVIDASVARPQVAAAAVAAAAGSLLTGAPAVTPLLVAEQTAATYDRQGRAVALAALLSPPFSLADRLGAAATHFAAMPQPLPLATARPQLLVKEREDLARRICAADLARFSEELTKLGMKTDKAEGQAYIANFAKERGLTLGSSTRFADQYTIGDDPGLAVLKARQETGHGRFAPQAPFGQQFFFETMTDQFGRPLGNQEAKGLYKPQPYPSAMMAGPSPTDPMFLVWRTAEDPARSPKDLSGETREKAEAGWRRLEARKLARQAADALAKEWNGKLGTDDPTIYRSLQDKIKQFEAQFPAPEAKARVKYFELRDVAPIVVQPSLQAGRYAAAPFTLTRTPDVPHPTPKMAEELLSRRNDPLSTSFVLVDQPEETYYVTVLYGRAERSPDDFARDVYAAIPQLSDVGPAVNARHQEELRKQARTAAVALLKAEFRYANEAPDAASRADSTSE